MLLSPTFNHNFSWFHIHNSGAFCSSSMLIFYCFQCSQLNNYLHSVVVNLAMARTAINLSQYLSIYGLFEGSKMKSFHPAEWHHAIEIRQLFLFAVDLLNIWRGSFSLFDYDLPSIIISFIWKLQQRERGRANYENVWRLHEPAWWKLRSIKKSSNCCCHNFVNSSWPRLCFCLSGREEAKILSQ